MTGIVGRVLELFFSCIAFQLVTRLAEQFCLGSYSLATRMLTLIFVIPRKASILFRWTGLLRPIVQGILSHFHQEFRSLRTTIHHLMLDVLLRVWVNQSVETSPLQIYLRGEGSP